MYATWSCDNAELVPLPFEGNLAARRDHPAGLARSGYRRERSLLLHLLLPRSVATPPTAESSMLKPLMLNVSLRCPVPESSCHSDVLMTLRRLMIGMIPPCAAPPVRILKKTGRKRQVTIKTSSHSRHLKFDKLNTKKGKKNE